MGDGDSFLRNHQDPLVDPKEEDDGSDYEQFLEQYEVEEEPTTEELAMQEILEEEFNPEPEEEW